ncbi:macrolide family glycosyltransferase [Amycolatopsis saalfeldensis]|uniref:Glycosyltransferase, MGT family n=1 Tax=Amycolatopsis saalfeldensis TaxID=394193 RepID=A0A1H8YNY1_9PSEU|nr:macrolide family glycosyltransferase [Amycolatopsis saalfeldensis]SEP53914.1 glycosyltransferase, MGT family [Amycolatopsis saalfeldensis]
MTKHIAVVSMPAHGHVNPTLPLVRELVRRGHRVTYPIAEPFRSAVTGAGADFAELPEWERPRRPPGKIEFTPELMGIMADTVIAQTRRTLPELLARFERDRPDVVCYDGMMPAGPMLAALLDVPAVQLFTSFASNEHYALREELFPGLDAGVPELAGALERIRRFAGESGVSRPVGALFAPVAEELNLVFLPRRFQFAGDSFDDRFVFVGPSVEGREGADGWQPPAPGTRLLFISLGTAMNNRPEFFRLCLEAFGGTSWRVAMAIGDQVDRAGLGPIPANFEVRPYFPQPAVLGRATAFLTHSGMNSTMESLAAGVPMVSVPQMGEQSANARRVEELGLGRRLPAEPTADVLRETVDAVADDPSIKANLADMAKVIRDAGGAPAAADALERLLA